jgi:flagellar operon protein
VGLPFSNVLESEVRNAGRLKFSAHAQQRLGDRGLVLTPGEQAGIERAVDLAAAKGARESVIFTDRLALVISVPNRTVITIIPRSELGDMVFTSIDSAVIVSEDTLPRVAEAKGLDPIWGSLSAADR